MEGWGGSGVPETPPQSADSCFPHCQRQELHYCRAKQSWTVPSCTRSRECFAPAAEDTPWLASDCQQLTLLCLLPASRDWQNAHSMDGDPPALHCNTVFTKEPGSEETAGRCGTSCVHEEPCTFISLRHEPQSRAHRHQGQGWRYWVYN